MPKRLTICPHLSLEELQKRYRNCSDPVEPSRYHIIWLLAQQKQVKEVAALTSYSSDWIYKLARRYNQQGVQGLLDGRHNNPGAAPLLSEVQQAQLWQVLQEPPADGGLWNSRKVADWLSELLDRPISRQRGWEYLRQMEFRLKVPRPAHQEADPFEQEAWKKNSKLKLPKSKLSIHQPLLNSGLWMNIVSDSSPFSDASGPSEEKTLWLQAIGVTNGFGSMVLFILKQEKPTSGFFPRSTLSCLIA